RLLKGNLGRGKPTLQVEPLAEMPDAPLWLSPIGQDLWHQIGAVLVAERIISKLDLACFGVLCATLARHRQAEEALQGALLVEGTSGSRRNPMVGIASEAARDAVSFAGLYGLTPHGRLRVRALGERKDTSKLDDLLA